MILLSFEVLTIQPDLVAQDIASRLDFFIVGLLLKFLGVVKILLANDYEILELRR